MVSSERCAVGSAERQTDLEELGEEGDEVGPSVRFDSDTVSLAVPPYDLDSALSTTHSSSCVND